MTKHKDTLNNMVADDLAPQGARASAAMEYNSKDMSINQVYILINILLNKYQKNPYQLAIVGLQQHPDKKPIEMYDLRIFRNRPVSIKPTTYC